MVWRAREGVWGVGGVEAAPVFQTGNVHFQQLCNKITPDVKAIAFTEKNVNVCFERNKHKIRINNESEKTLCVCLCV